MAEEKIKQILVFKTNLYCGEDISSIAVALDGQSGVYKWNVDMDDCDHVLRVVADPSLKATRIMGLLKKHGYVCEELQ